jgi:hypothetical protein
MILMLTAGCSNRGQPTNTDPNTASLADQKLCSEQAAKFFEKQSATGTSTNHYDVAAKVCYIEITNFDAYARASTVYDAFGEREYGELLTQKTKSGPDIVECDVQPPGQSRIECKSDDEFDSLALKYFGTTAH